MLTYIIPENNYVTQLLVEFLTNVVATANSRRDPFKNDIFSRYRIVN